MTKTAKVTFAAVIAAFTLTACNTIQGAGTDIKKTGNAIEDTADKAKPK